MEIGKQSNKILKCLLKDFTIKQSITNISKEIGLSRPGAFKTLKKLELQKFIILTPIGKGKTSTYVISLNWKNPLLEKMIAIILADESIKNQRWINLFAELEKKTDFCMIYGSILNDAKEANDIDILCVPSSKKNFVEIEKITSRIQKSQIKKIHLLQFTQNELKTELKNKNEAFIDAIKKGIILYGHEKFIKFIRRLSNE